jgi:hypothetical protein
MHEPYVPALPFHQMYKGLNQKNHLRVHVGYPHIGSGLSEIFLPQDPTHSLFPVGRANKIIQIAVTNNNASESSIHFE